MADRNRVRFRPTAVGLAAILFPPLLLFLPGGFDSPPVVLMAVGLPAVAVLSFFILLTAAPSVVRAAHSLPEGTGSLPSLSRIGEGHPVGVELVLPAFHPGLRFSFRWILRFGPCRWTTAARLSASGIGRTVLTAGQRGVWRGIPVIRAVDPFGFFILDCAAGGPREVLVPPKYRETGVGDPAGRSSSDSATAPRLKDDAEERMDRREYRPGDDTRHLDWKQLARTGDLMIRVGEDGVPVRGRAWLQVVGSFGGANPGKASFRRLDAAASACGALARRLEEMGQDVQIRIPGERKWSGGSEDIRNDRLATALPASESPVSWPGRGERVWIIGHPADPAIAESARRARESGCRVAIGLPEDPHASWTAFARGLLFRSEVFGPDSGVSKGILYRYRSAKATDTCRAGGFDVRRI